MSRLTYHNTLLGAIIQLEKAGHLPIPTLEEKLLQISIGG